MWFETLSYGAESRRNVVRLRQVLPFRDLKTLSVNPEKIDNIFLLIREETGCEKEEMGSTFNQLCQKIR